MSMIGRIYLDRELNRLVYIIICNAYINIEIN